jgi:predicted dehydrogenase
MLTIPFGHTADALCWCLGEFKSVDATLGYLRTTGLVVETGETIAMTAADQIVVGGTLESGAAAAIQYRAGLPRGTKLLWEINGTHGDLRITSDGGHLGMFDMVLSGGRGDVATVQPLDIPDTYRGVAAGLPQGLPLNVALTYAKLARDIKEGTKLSATFDDAVVRHRMIAAIEASAETGQRQSYVPNSSPRTRRRRAERVHNRTIARLEQHEKV